MTAPLIRSPDADARLAELAGIIGTINQSAKRRQWHRQTYDAALAGARSALRLAALADKNSFPAEAAEHRGRARYYLALARRHKEALA